MSLLVLGQQTSANVSSVSYLCCCLQVEAVPKDIALIVEAAVTRALAADTGLSISKTNLWNVSVRGAQGQPWVLRACL